MQLNKKKSEKEGQGDNNCQCNMHFLTFLYSAESIFCLAQSHIFEMVDLSSHHQFFGPALRSHIMAPVIVTFC